MSPSKISKSATISLPAAIEEMADNAEFDSEERLAVAARLVMAQHTRKLYSHLPGVLSGDDPHDVHQMRVATRRLRASLQATALAFQPETVQSLRNRLRKLAKALGEVRDRDVLLIRMRKDAEERAEDDELHTALEQVERAAHRDEIADAIKRLEGERRAAHADAVDEIERKRTARLLNDLTDFLTCPLEDVAASDDGLPLLVRHLAGGAIWREYEAVLRFESVMPGASSERLHALRIACKHLRYTLELFEPALRDDAKSLIKLVTAMQDQLGLLHDTDVALDYLGVAHPDAADQIGVAGNGAGKTGIDGAIAQAAGVPIDSYGVRRSAERERMLADVAPIWNQLTQVSTRRKLARLIADL